MRRVGVRAIAGVLAAALAMGLAACGGGGGGDGDGGASPSGQGSATIGPEGGEVSGPDGVKLVVPAGALSAPTTLRIARDGSGAPELGGAKAISPVYAVTPHGTAFAESARISIPFKPEDVAPGTQPVLLRAQAGGGWEALATDVSDGTLSAADTPGLSYYAVGTCYTTRDASIPGPDPLLYCPSANRLQLTLLDANRVAVPVPRDGNGVAQPAQDLRAPTNLTFVLSWTRPAGTSRSDHVWMRILDAGLQPAQQPLSDLAVDRDFTQTFTVTLDPATVPGANASGKVIRLQASVDYTTDAFYLGCVCFKPATWTFSAEIPLRVIYTGSTPVITLQPANVAVTAGQAATFTVAATGPNLSAVWTRGRGAAPNDLPATAVAMPAGVATYTIPATSVASHDGWVYAAQVCSNRGTSLERCVLSNGGVLSVAPVVVAPVFTTPPASVTVTAGQTASFTAVASGQPAPTIAWSRIVSTPLGDALDPICSPTTGTGSSTTATCTTAPLTLSDNGLRIQAGASNGPNGNNAVNSAIATVTVLPQPVAPTITTPAEPADRTVTEGSSVTWTVGAGGTAPLSYAWRTQTPGGSVIGGINCEGGYNVAPATAATVTLPSLPLACNGHRFFVVVSNGVNPAAESRRALLTVTPAAAAPSITSGLADRSVVEGTQVTFSVAATGTPATFTYAWTLDGAPVPAVVSGCGAASAACTFTAQLADSGKTLAVRVANGTAPDATSSGVLTVSSTDMPAAIVTQPASQSATVGQPATFTIGVAGTPTPGVTWQTSPDGLTWTGAGSGTSLTLAGVTLAQSGLRVRALVSNTTRVPAGTQVNLVTSNEVTLTVVTDDTAYEGFEGYPAGEGLTGKNGGTGWGGRWEVVDSAGNAVNSGALVATGLDYTDANGRQLVTRPGAWQTDAGVVAGIARRLTSGSFGASGERWVSFLFRTPSVLDGSDIAAVTLGTGAGDGPTRTMAGLSYDYPSVSGLFSGSGGVNPGLAPNTVLMVLVQVRFGADPNFAPYNDEMNLWINPPLEAALGAPQASYPSANFVDAVRGLSLLWSRSTTGAPRNFVFDELRIAPTRAGVSPAR